MFLDIKVYKYTKLYVKEYKTNIQKKAQLTRI